MNLFVKLNLFPYTNINTKFEIKQNQNPSPLVNSQNLFWKSKLSGFSVQNVIFVFVFDMSGRNWK
jgi:hypothetical protein